MEADPQLNWIRWFLPAFWLVFAFLCFLLRTLRVWKRTGIFPIRYEPKPSPQRTVSRLGLLALVVATALIALYSFASELRGALGPLRTMENCDEARFSGAAILVLSVSWVAIAQAQMGSSWRIGIDSEHPTGLVEAGLFRISRNPIYLGIVVALMGLVLVMPTVASILLLLFGTGLLRAQIRLEEQHMAALHGDRFRDYCSRVRRWI